MNYTLAERCAICQYSNFYALDDKRHEEKFYLFYVEDNTFNRDGDLQREETIGFQRLSHGFIGAFQQDLEK